MVWFLGILSGWFCCGLFRCFDLLVFMLRVCLFVLFLGVLFDLLLVFVWCCCDLLCGGGGGLGVVVVFLWRFVLLVAGFV